jgi:hypothetical protein
VKVRAPSTLPAPAPPRSLAKRIRRSPTVQRELLEAPVVAVAPALLAAPDAAVAAEDGAAVGEALGAEDAPAPAVEPAEPVVEGVCAPHAAAVSTTVLAAIARGRKARMGRAVIQGSWGGCDVVAQ